MSVESILSSWKSNQFKPVYWLEGEEGFFIDELVQYAEHQIMPEDQASFNLTVFYGKDADWTEVMNACRRYPVFAERQVVLLKEAQQMRDIDKLESYIEKPNASTVFIVAYKGKTIDGRTRFSRLLKKYGEIFTSKKVYDNQLPAWTNGYVQSRGLQIKPKALALLVDHVGNDLSRLTNEVKKLAINLEPGAMIAEGDIEKYIGISKDYNIFELQDAISFKDFGKAISVIQYMESNPKAFAIQMLLPALYAYFTRLMVVNQMNDKSENSLRPFFYNNPSAIRQALGALRNYTFSDMEKAVLLLHHYNLKAIGIGSYNTSPASLIKELVFKIMK